MSAGRDYLHNVAAQAVGRTASMAASFLAFVLLARVLGSDVLGQYTFVLAFVTTAGTLADFGTSAALARGIVDARQRDGGAYLGSYLLLRVALAALVTVLALPVALLIRPEIRVPLLMGCALIPVVTMQFFDPVYQAYGRARYAAYLALALGGARLGMAVFVLYGIGGGLVAYLAGYLLAQVVFLAVAVALMLRLLAPRWPRDTGHARATLRLAAPMGVAELFNAIYTRTDVVLLAYLRPAAEVGHYAAAARLLDLAVIVAVVATTPLVPVLTQRLLADREAARRLCMRVGELAVIACLPVALLAGVVAEPLMRALYGPAFVPAAALLPVFAWLLVATLWFMIASAINLATGNVRHGYWSSAVTALLNIGLNLWLIPRHGMLGAAWATVASVLFKVAVAQAYVWVGLGSVFAWSRWLRIGVAGGVLAAGVELSATRYPVAGSIASLVAYGLVVVVSGLLRGDGWRASGDGAASR